MAKEYLSRIQYVSSNKTNNNLLNNTNSINSPISPSGSQNAFNTLEPYTPTLYFVEDHFQQGCPSHNSIFVPKIENINSENILALPLSYKNRIPYNNNSSNYKNHTVNLTLIGNFYKYHQNRPLYMESKGFVFSITNFFKNVLSTNQCLFQLCGNIIAVYLIDGYLYLFIKEMKTSVGYINASYRSTNKLPSEVKYIKSTINYGTSAYGSGSLYFDNIHTFSFEFLDENKNKIYYNQIILYPKSNSISFTFTDLNTNDYLYGSQGTSGNINDNSYIIYYTTENNNGYNSVPTSDISYYNFPVFKIGEKNTGLVYITNNSFSDPTVLFLNNFYTSSDKILDYCYNNQAYFDNFNNNFDTMLVNLTKLDFYKYYYMFLDSNDPDESNESNILYRYITSLYLTHVAEVADIYEKDLINNISISVPNSIFKDIPISIQIKKDLAQDILNPIEVTIGKYITPVDPFNITITTTSKLKPLKEIEDDINKRYLGTQQAAEDFQLLMKVTETSYWPVEFTIDNNYHIHIKPDPIYIGATLYACTNKQFLYHKYAIS